MPSTVRYPNRTATTMLAFTLLSLLSSCHASGLRGRDLNLLDGAPAANGNVNAQNCKQELSFDIVCQGDCNFTALEGTCESKMFQYHGGPCRSALSTTRSSDSAANCQDLNQGPPSALGEEVFVVISDAKDPAKNSSMWTTVGGFFKTDYRDYPIGLGLSDQQNITVYASNETSHDNMLQTMLFYAPCEGTPLEHLDADQSVQLFATAVDPTIRALFHLHIASQNPAQQQQQQAWQVTSVSTVTVTGRGPAELEQMVLSDLTSATTAAGDIEIPFVVELNRNDTLTIVSSASLITSSGLKCGVSALYTNNPGNPNPRSEASNQAYWP